LGELLSGDKLKEAMIINIDNKSENQNFGDIVLVTPQASSLSEQIGDLLLALGFLLIKIVLRIYSVVLLAQQEFPKSQTSSLAFEVAGFLMRKGATRPRETRQEASQFTPKPLESKHVQDSQGVEERLPQRTPRFEEEEKPQPKIDEDKPHLIGSRQKSTKDLQMSDKIEGIYGNRN